MQRQVLVVEDNEINRGILCEILSADYQVLEAENGQQALDMLRRNKDTIALVLLDVMMPVMNGYEFLDCVRRDKELSLIPVIVMTQSDKEDDEVAALAHGATDFVPKPYRPQVILHRVASIIRLRETAAMVNQFQYDRLTGLYSKEFFYQKVRERLAEEPEEEYSIVCSNIENFKLFNDIFGAREGDRLLQEVAEIARRSVGSTGFCGRFGADRFLCLQKREREQEDRRNFGCVVDREPSPRLKNATMRWGIYEITDRSVPVEQMCDRAQLAADSIKGQYNQYFAVYDDSLRSQLLREQTVTAAMEPALAQEQFLVYLQPKYSLDDGRMSGAEALVRWVHPELGFLSPGEFIPLFEKNGFISRLDQYVWEQVCIRLRDWRERGLPMLPVSVNVSRADVYQTQLADTLLALTKKYGVDPAYLHLEITESVCAENPSKIIAAVKQLRQRGFIVEMDDFGSGYSSLNMLGQLELDVLKLDMKFVQNEMMKSEDRCILHDIVSMAHRMHLSVVAEGVETREQMERLHAIGCDYVQGYFLARPMPVAEFEALLKNQPARAEAPRPRERQAARGIRELLVVEEDDAYREKVRRTFAGQYRVLEASDAESALECISSLNRDGIAAVILSMTIPDGGAAAVLKALRQDPAYWHVPVLSTIPQCNVREDLPLALDTDDFLCKCHPILDLRRRVDRMVGVELCREREYTLREEANRDFMTGLLNRRGLEAALEGLRKEEQPLAVCLFDLDGLKVVNDTMGHEAGDRMLRSFAELLQRKTRAGDILCRYGGDEFVVILKRLEDAETARKKGEDICRSFAREAKDGLPSSCSAGIAMCGAGERMSAEIIDRADQALYRAKRGGKSGCCLWSSELRTTLRP